MGLNLDAVGAVSEPAERSWDHKDALLVRAGRRRRRARPHGVRARPDHREFGSGSPSGSCPPSPRSSGKAGAPGPPSVTSTRPCWSTASRRSGCTARSRRRERCRPRPRWPGCTTRVRPASSCSRASRAMRRAGKLAFTSRSALFIRGAGGFGGPRNPEGDEESALAAEPLPTREPDEVVTYATRPRPGAPLPPLGRPQPVALRPHLRQAGRVRPPDPARVVHLRLHRAGPSPHRVRLGPVALRRHAGPFLQADACPATP